MLNYLYMLLAFVVIPFQQIVIPNATGGSFDSTAVAGRKILLVPVSSASEFNDQIADLQSLSVQNDQRLLVIAIPTADFDTSGMASDSAFYLQLQQSGGITFGLTPTLTGAGGPGADLFDWLTHGEKNGMGDLEIKGPYEKFLINERGTLIAVFAPEVSPLDPSLVHALDQ